MPLLSQFQSVVETFVFSYLKRQARLRRMSFIRFNTIQGHLNILLSREQFRQRSEWLRPFPTIMRRPGWAALTQRYATTRYPDAHITIVSYADASLQNSETQRGPVHLLPNTPMGLRTRPMRYIQDRSYQGNFFDLTIRIRTSSRTRPTFASTKARPCLVGIPTILRSQ